MGCSTGEQDHQPFPSKGTLSDNSNISLETLRGSLSSERTVVYRYVITSVHNEGGRFLQRGSGPNFQGGMVTLCTCKHRMRTYLRLDDWKGKWVAGFTGLGAGRGRNALVYLTKIAHAYESHYDLWYSGEIPDETKRAKSATLSRYGDLLEPLGESVDPYDPFSYHPPDESHSHSKNDSWHGDVRYTGSRHRHEAALLVGDPAHTYLWDRPTLFFPNSIGRAEPKSTLEDLLSKLQTV
jgi:hypothetical protein